MRFTIFQESRVGKRRTNQDRVAYSYTRDALLLVLADGMGGHLYGEVAAQISVQFIAQSFQQEARPKVTDPILFLSRVLSNAHHAILDYAFDKHLADIPRTTIVALRPVWQMVLISVIESAQASRYWLPSNNSPWKSVRRP